MSLPTEVTTLHAMIQYYEAIGCWGMAQHLRKILSEMVTPTKQAS